MRWVPEARYNELLHREQELAAAAPYLGYAMAMAAQMGKLTDPGQGEPVGLDEALALAEQAVRDQEIQILTHQQREQMTWQREQEIRNEVREELGPGIQAQVEADFRQNEEPRLRARVTAEVERDLRRSTSDRLRRERPDQIAEEVRAQYGPTWIAEETERFQRDEPELRARTLQSERTAMTAHRREELASRIRADARQTVEERVRAQEIAKRDLEDRIEDIQRKARNGERLEFSDLRTDDVLIVELCERSEAHSGRSTKATRTLRISVRDEANGIAMIMDDSWHKGSPLERENSIEDGTIITLSTATRLPEGSPEQPAEVAPDTRTARAFTKGVGLRIMIGQQEAKTAKHEVSRVSLVVDGQPRLLLGPPEEMSARSGMGNRGW